MKIEIVKGNLFDLLDNRAPVHCISADARMGAGIAVPMRERFKLEGLRQMELKVGRCYLHNGVYNLITKNRAWDKPTYPNFTETLMDLERMINRCDVPKSLIMPAIGCGLDGLKWELVLPIIKYTFKFTDADILVVLKEVRICE